MFKANIFESQNNLKVLGSKMISKVNASLPKHIIKLEVVSRFGEYIM
jgi:hypothetical protein